jgi:antitoxin component HigA of HigAB toxin-antitoxin module
MDIKPIRTQRDYKTALAEIERLFQAKPGTPDGDRLDVLATKSTNRSTIQCFGPIPSRPSDTSWRAEG